MSNAPYEHQQHIVVANRQLVCPLQLLLCFCLGFQDLVKSQSCKMQQQMAPTDTGHCSPNVCTATWLQHAADILAVHCTEMLLQVTLCAVQRRSGSPEHALMTCPQASDPKYAGHSEFEITLEGQLSVVQAVPQTCCVSADSPDAARLSHTSRLLRIPVMVRGRPNDPSCQNTLSF